jgi:hypothetical protein
MRKKSAMVRIVFTASQTWMGRVIRWLSKGRVSHVFLQHQSKVWGGDWATEATWPMVLQRPAERSRHNIVKEFFCEFGAPAALSQIRDEVGKWYSFDGLFALGFWLLFWRVFHRKLRHPFHSVRGNLCSELVVKMLRAATDVPNTRDLDPDYTTPEMLLTFCEMHPAQFKEISP